MQIALTLILALLAIAALATAMRAIVIARAAAWMDMVAIGATDSCESAGYVGCSVVCTGVDNMQQIESLLDVEYDRYETIVVLDARAAGITFRAIVARYDLIRVDADPSDEFPSARIRSLFRSRTRSMRRLTLVDRAAASPYDDLDAGASVASYDYILPVGRDTYLMPNAIEKAVIAIASTPDTPIAALRSVSDDQCYVFNRETLIAQGGFSPHLLNSIRSGEVRRTFVPPHIPHKQHDA
ncbi:MAG: glycosyltransferase family 2 protein [Bacteroidales bacterium]|nr:MAG: glycosyltransferase family 2 protein [Bacteroidales bacterium]